MGSVLWGPLHIAEARHTPTQKHLTLALVRLASPPIGQFKGGTRLTVSLNTGLSSCVHVHGA
jgi:hypothetical protein